MNPNLQQLMNLHALLSAHGVINAPGPSSTTMGQVNAPGASTTVTGHVGSPGMGMTAVPSHMYTLPQAVNQMGQAPVHQNPVASLFHPAIQSLLRYL